jgi:hypothetical protein
VPSPRGGGDLAAASGARGGSLWAYPDAHASGSKIFSTSICKLKLRRCIRLGRKVCIRDVLLQLARVTSLNMHQGTFSSSSAPVRLLPKDIRVQDITYKLK